MKKKCRKVLSLLLSVSMLLSCMVWTGASVDAATDPIAFHYTFSQSDTTTLNYFNGDSNNRNSAFYDGETYNGNYRSVKCTYDTSTIPSVFSLPNNSGSSHNGRNNGQTVYLMPGRSYRVTVTYKVNSYTCSFPSKLYFAIGMGNLHNLKWSVFTDSSNKMLLATIDGTTDGWVTVSQFVTPSTSNGAYTAIVPENLPSSDGASFGSGNMEVLIGEVHYVPVTLVQITKNNNGATDTFTAAVGDPLDLGIPTRDGYDFAGWYTDTNYTTLAPDTVPSANATYYAKWDVHETKYDAVFIANGETVATLNGKADDPIEAPVPYLNGYNFEYWCSDAGLTTPVNPTAIVVGGATYYAKLTPWDLTPLVMRHAFNNADYVSYTGAIDGNYNTGKNNSYQTTVADGGMQISRSANDPVTAVTFPDGSAAAYPIAAFRLMADALGDYNAEYLDTDTKPKMGGGNVYYAVVKYKAVNLPADTSMRVWIGSQAWRSDTDFSNAAGNGGCYSNVITLPRGMVNDEWQYARFYVPCTGKNGLHLIVTSPSSSVKGTKIIIDEMNVYAVISDSAVTKVTLNDQLGIVNDTYYPAGKTYTFPETYRAGYVYDGWYCEPECTTPAPALIPQTAVTYYANMIKEHTVSFKKNGHVFASFTGIPGTEYTLPDELPQSEFGHIAQWQAEGGDVANGVIGNADLTYTPVQAQIVESFEGYDVFSKNELVDPNNDKSPTIGSTKVFSNGSARYITDEYTYNGERAVKMDLAVAASDNGSYARFAPQYPVLLQSGESRNAGHAIKTDADHIFRVKVWVMSPESMSFTLKVGTDSSLTSMWGGGSTTKVNGTKTVSLVAGEWQQITVDASGFNGDYLTVGGGSTFADESKFVYLDDLTVEKIEIYTPNALIGDFEKATVGEDRNLSSDTVYTNAVITDEMNHTFGGGTSMKIWGTDGSGNTRAQVLMTDSENKPIVIKTGRTYDVSFWIYAPKYYNFANGYTNPNNIHRCWLAVADESTPFSASYTKDSHKFYEQNTANAVMDGWFNISTSFTATQDGFLRVGMSESSGGVNSGYMFYMDDVEVTERSAMSNCYSYEDLAVNTDVDLRHGSTHTAKVSSATSRSGEKALIVTNVAQGSGNDRAQVLLKNPDGTDYTITENHDYLISFWAKAGTQTGFRFWVAAQQTEGEGFSVSGGTTAASNSKQAYTLFKTGTTSDADYIGNDVTVSKTEWQQFTAFVTAQNDAADLGTHKVLIGIMNAAGVNGTMYFDDFSIVDLTEDAAVAADDVSEFDMLIQDYESFEADVDSCGLNDVSGKPLARTVTTIKDRKGEDTQALKVCSYGVGSAAYSAAVVNIGGKNIRISSGDQYTVTAWVYSPKAGNYHVRLGSAIINGMAGAVSDESEVKYQESSDTKLVFKEPGWQRVSITTVFSGPTKQGSSFYMTLGGGYEGTGLEVVYFDDITVAVSSDAVEMSGAGLFVSTASTGYVMSNGSPTDYYVTSYGSPILYKNGKGEKEYISLRVFSEYQSINTGQREKIIISEETYDIQERGILLGYADDATHRLQKDDSSTVLSNAKTQVKDDAYKDLHYVWDVKKNDSGSTATVTTSMLINGVSEKTSKKDLVVRSYVVVDMGDGTKKTFYSVVQYFSVEQIALSSGYEIPWYGGKNISGGKIIG